jgi:hypothetical protein
MMLKARLGMPRCSSRGRVAKSMNTSDETSAKRATGLSVWAPKRW